MFWYQDRLFSAVFALESTRFSLFFIISIWQNVLLHIFSFATMVGLTGAFAYDPMDLYFSFCSRLILAENLISRSFAEDFVAVAP